MSDYDYSGEAVDLEVARYGLRTFKAIPPRPGPEQDIVLGPVWIPARGHWLDGTCQAKCYANSYHTDDNGNVWVIMQTSGRIAKPHTSAPQEDCDCGIYAAHTLGNLAAQYNEHASKIVTVIAAEGQTIIGDKGFRTQYARVVAYWCISELAKAAEKQFKDAKRYGRLNDMLRDYDFPAPLEKFEWGPWWARGVRWLPAYGPGSNGGRLGA